MKKMKKNWAIIIIFSLLLISSLNLFTSYNLKASGVVIYVGLNGEGDFTSIQEAIDNAVDGDTVHVNDGVYYENIVINKSINLFGSGKGISVIDGSFNEYVIYLSADNITIQDFTIKNGQAGILLKNSSNILIKQNTIRQNNYGISIDNSSNNVIHSNNFVNNTKNAYDEYTNTWYKLDSKYGNYWDDYSGIDNNANGVGDTPYNITGGNNKDIYPLMQPINQKPQVIFSYSPMIATTQENIQFNDTSNDIDGDIISWLWDFGDGNTSDLKKPSHRYIDNGTYTITLILLDDLGISNFTKQNISVLNVGPTASFYYTPNSTTPTTQQTIQFNDASNDIDGDIISWLWDFGDGNTSDLKKPSHRYIDDGTYTVTLTVTDDDLAKKVIFDEIQVLNVGPTASFIFKPYKPTINDTITFSDSSNDPDGKIVSRSWDFGDGTKSDKISPTHRYNEGRTYTVKLTVTDNDGQSDTKIMDIAILDLSAKTQDYNGFVIVFIVFIIMFSTMIYFVLWIRKKEK